MIIWKYLKILWKLKIIFNSINSICSGLNFFCKFKFNETQNKNIRCLELFEGYL